MSDNPNSFIEEARTLTENVKNLYQFKSKWPQFTSIVITISLMVWNGFKLQEKLHTTIVVLVLSFSFLALLAFQEYRYSRKAKYAESLSYIHSIVHRLRNNFHIINKIDSSSEETRKLLNRKVFEEVEKVVTSFAVAFSLITSAKCRACIKLIRIDETHKDYHKLSNEEKEKVLYVETWTRDIDSQPFQPDEEPRHWIYANTDFYQLFNVRDPRINKYFFANNLPKMCNYNNTSFKSYGDPNEKKWALPYKSTMVWPIRRITSHEDDREEGQLGDKQDVLGYLCIDCNSRNVFNERYDTELGAIIADSLFVFLRRYNMVTTKKREERIK